MLTSSMSWRGCTPIPQQNITFFAWALLTELLDSGLELLILIDSFVGDNLSSAPLGTYYIVI